MKRKSIFIIKLVVLASFIVLLLRLFYLQIIKGDFYLNQANNNTLRRTFSSATRGKIYSMDGELLAENKSSFYVALLPGELNKLEQILPELGALLNISPQRIRNKLNNSTYSLYTPVKIKDRLTFEEFAQIVEKFSNYEGVEVGVEPLRYYPKGEIFAHTVGYVGAISEEEYSVWEAKGYMPWEIIGKDGIEYSYEGYLHGKKGVKEFEVDATGYMVKLLQSRDPIPGDSIYLTLEPSLQETAYKYLSQTIQELDPMGNERTSGTVIMLDIQSGAIKVMVNYPSFDPNLFIKGVSKKEYQKLIEDPRKPLFNRAIAGLYPPASTFKLVTGIGALEEQLISPYEDQFYCPGYFKIGNQEFLCWQKYGHNYLNFNEALAQSCDVVFYQLGYRLGWMKLKYYAEKMGLGRITGIDLPGESPGLIPDEKWKIKNLKEPWYPGDTVNISIGQGFLEVTPLQASILVTAVANGGYLVKPYLVQEIHSSDGKIIYSHQPVERNTGISPQTLEIIREGMLTAVEKGTAQRAKSIDIKVAGKTGTVENSPSAENPYGRNHTWFVGFAPYENPQIVICVFLEKSGGHGGDVATPLAGEILKAWLAESKK